MENLCKYKGICEQAKRNNCGFEDERDCVECHIYQRFEKINDEEIVNEFINNVIAVCEQVEGEFPPDMCNKSRKVREFIRKYNIKI